MKTIIRKYVNEKIEELFSITKDLYNHPELGEEEHYAAQTLSNYLENEGFSVERGVYGIETAFSAKYVSQKKGETIAYLCEYDALPEIGHACGHNLIAAMSVGAAIGLKAVLDEIGGSVIVLGTPAEETNGAKGTMVREGAFDGVFAAMMAHPAPESEESGATIALSAYKFEFFGKPAHAAVSPEKGINALDAVILLFNGINALRQHVTDEIRIHGIISRGGIAPNIVPDYAEAKFYIRAEKRVDLDELLAKIIGIAHGSELMTGAKVKISEFENSYDNLRSNRELSKLFTKNLYDMGEKKINPPKLVKGSIDFGDVSQIIPSIHPWIGMGNSDLALHTREFAENTITKQAKESLLKGATALAMTGYDIIISDDNRSKIEKEFKLI